MQLAGWGESGGMLLYAEMPYLHYDECISEIPLVMQRYVTLDKFCAQSNKGNIWYYSKSELRITSKKLQVIFPYLLNSNTILKYCFNIKITILFTIA